MGYGAKSHYGGSSMHRPNEDCCSRCITRVPYATLIALILCWAGVGVFCGTLYRGVNLTLRLLQDVFRLDRGLGWWVFDITFLYALKKFPWNQRWIFKYDFLGHFWTDFWSIVFVLSEFSPTFSIEVNFSACRIWKLRYNQRKKRCIHLQMKWQKFCEF